MKRENPFETRAADYDAWFDAHPAWFESELRAIRAVLPERAGPWVEIGVGTGRFAAQLGIELGIEPTDAMAAVARARGVRVARGVAEDLPIAAGSIDAAFFITTLCFVSDVGRALAEARRVLSVRGRLIVAILPRDGDIGRRMATDAADPFFRSAQLLTVEELHAALATAGFRVEREVETLINLSLPECVEEPRRRAGLGSFVVVRAAPAADSRAKARCGLDRMNLPFVGCSP